MGANGPKDEAVHGKRRLSRRTLLKGGLALGAAGTAGVAGLSSSAGASIDRALALAPSTLPTLSDIRHVVFLMQENRSFDHYFGTLSGVRGFSDPRVVTNKINGRRVPAWDQYGYHCSVLGPTDPNRVMALSGTIDPAGTGGGPVLVTQTTGRPQQYGAFDWTTMPEQLLDAGVTWKVYNDPTGLALFSPLPYFKAYTEETTR
jgi:phospholipase C